MIKVPLVVASVLLAIGAVLAMNRTGFGPKESVRSSVEAQASFEPEAPEEAGVMLTRIHCPEGYQAFVFAVDLRGADGLALDSEGRLLVVEEGRGEITRFNKDGTRTTLAANLKSPEGVFAGPDSEIFVVEDTRNGRLLSFDKNGSQTTLATGLDAPEGVVFVEDRLFVTESTAEFENNKLQLHTRLIKLQRKGSSWSHPELIFERGLPFSFSELVADGATRLIIANELAGPLARSGLMSFDLERNELTPFATGLVSPEGLSWSANGSWPLFVAEEDSNSRGQGRLSTVDQNGERSTFATGFSTIEDVVVTRDGHIFVSEDAHRQIVELRPG